MKRKFIFKVVFLCSLILTFVCSTLPAGAEGGMVIDPFTEGDIYISGTATPRSDTILNQKILLKYPVHGVELFAFVDEGNTWSTSIFTGSLKAGHEVLAIEELCIEGDINDIEVEKNFVDHTVTFTVPTEYEATLGAYSIRISTTNNPDRGYTIATSSDTITRGENKVIDLNPGLQSLGITGEYIVDITLTTVNFWYVNDVQTFTVLAKEKVNPINPDEPTNATESANDIETTNGAIVKTGDFTSGIETIRFALLSGIAICMVGRKRRI